MLVAFLDEKCLFFNPISYGTYFDEWKGVGAFFICRGRTPEQLGWPPHVGGEIMNCDCRLLGWMKKNLFLFGFLWYLFFMDGKELMFSSYCCTLICLF